MSISCYPLHRVRTKTGMRENNKAGAHAPKPTRLELEHWTRLDRRYPNHRYQIHIDTSRGPSSLDACDSMVASRQRSSCTGMRARAGIPPRIAPQSQRASAAVVQTFALRIACRRLPPPLLRITVRCSHKARAHSSQPANRSLDGYRDEIHSDTARYRLLTSTNWR
jgi:hypothetical protein